MNRFKVVASIKSSLVLQRRLGNKRISMSGPRWYTMQQQQENTMQGSTSPTAKLEEAFAGDIGAIPLPDKLEKLVSNIEALTLIETAQVVKALKKRLGLTDMPAMTNNSIMTGSSTAGGTNPTTSTAGAPTAEKAAPEEQKDFKVTLVKFDAGAKAKIIREMKVVLPNLNLVEAKNFVEGAPKVIKEKISKVDAEKIQKQFEALGATIKIE